MTAGPPNTAMTMTEHLAELRFRLLVSLITLTVAVVVAFFAALPVIDLFKHLAPGSVLFVQLTPGEVLMASVRISVLLGTVLASPVILYHLLRFILPGLQGRERLLVFWIAAGGFVLFAAGMVFSYFLVIPSALGFLLEFGQTVAASQISIASFVDFCTSLLLLTGILFELPMVLTLLSFTGLVTSQKLLAHWKTAVVVILVVAAVVTPSQDPITLLVVSAAMTGLYFLSLLPIRLMGR